MKREELLLLINKIDFDSEQALRRGNYALANGLEKYLTELRKQVRGN
jgi:hypothetical protein